VAYEILSKTSLTNTAWAGEQPIVIGAAGQDWTPTTVAIGTRTNELFFWARTLVDTDGDGLPDWWELEHDLNPNNPDTGDTGVSDGYKDSDNDGWTNLQEYQNGTSPSQFNTPAASQTLVVATDATGTHAKLSWLPASGPVTGYTIERYYPNTQISLSSSTHSHVDTQTNLPTGLFYDAQIPQYRIRAEYAGGSAAWSEWKNVTDLISPIAKILPAQNGGAQVFVAALPAAAAAVRVGNVAYNDGLYLLNNVDIPVAQFTNGLAALPATFYQTATNFGQYVRFVLTNTANGAINYTPNATPNIQPFWDGRAQLKDNLRFLFRAASTYNAFGYSESNGNSPTDYLHSSYYQISDWWDFFGVRHCLTFENPLRPHADNYYYRNFVFSTTNLNVQGRSTTGVYWDPSLNLTTPHQFNFVPPATPVAIPSVLTAPEAQWTVWTGYGPPRIAFSFLDENEFGVTAQENETGYVLSMTSGLLNWFGLPYQSFKLAWGDNAGSTATLSPNNSVALLGDSGYFYPEVAAPDFQLVNYYFTRLVSTSQPTVPPMPGYTDFAITNATPLLIASVGETNFKLAGYAKLAVTNGYAGVYGYLGQYFDQAYTTTNGVVTTNETGILSPYGEFFPTEPGRTALVTMPDLDTGARGTATVYVVSMNLDANHDGEMDRTFYGPDPTSVTKPFRFWINDDNDGADYSDGWEINAPGVPDYRDNEIKTKRDLEDFARLWISGIPPLPAGQGYVVTLSSSGPGIQLFPAYEADGGIDYLTNATTAANQITSDSRLALGRIAPGTNYVFPDGYFATFGRKHFLFEGTTAGNGAVTLTIAQNTNVLMQTSVFMDLHDVEAFYERAVATNVPSGLPPSTLISQYQLLASASALPDERKQVIIHVHGINISEFQWKTERDTIFKRLYWSGYDGRFASFRWPCAYLPFENTLWPFNYNKGEFYSWKSATALKNYLSYLTNRADLAGYSLNILAHSQGTVITSEAIRQGAPFDNYILTQAATPAHSYDTNAPFLQKLLTAETNNAPTPFYTTNGGYHGYFANLSGGHLINFFNTNDFALVSGTYLGQQANWERNQETQKPEAFFLAQSYSYFPSSWRNIAFYDFSQYDVTDPHEIMSMIARSRSRAVGAQSGLGGSIESSVDLLNSFGFGTSRDEHSAQLTRPVQTVLGYYRTVLIQIQPAP
jgi:hypothetical protein